MPGVVWAAGSCSASGLCCSGKRNRKAPRKRAGSYEGSECPLSAAVPVQAGPAAGIRPTRPDPWGEVTRRGACVDVSATVSG